MCDIEFTVERGRLWVLQARVGQRTGIAEVRIAADMLEPGTIDPGTALERISPAGLIRLQRPGVRPRGAARGARSRHAPLRPARPSARWRPAPPRRGVVGEGRPVILARPETSPDDIAGFIAAEGVLTARGGRASHAAVVARGLNLPAVCSVTSLSFRDGGAAFGARLLSEGDVVTVDGTTGEVHAGALALVAPPPHPETERLLAECDRRRRVRVSRGSRRRGRMARSQARARSTAGRPPTCRTRRPETTRCWCARPPLRIP